MGKALSLLLIFGLLNSCHRVIVRDTSATDSSAIIGGETASTTQLSFLINIWQNSPNEGYIDHICGGSLIGKKWVLTAAHCVLDAVSEKEVGTVKVSELSLFIGSDLRSGQGGRKLTAKNIHVHPDFSWPKHDVALIELNDEVLDVTPVVLNSVKDLGAQAGVVATVAGWGLTDANGTEGTTLQKVQVPLLSRDACAEDSFPKKRGWKIGLETLCAVSTHDTKSACQGDSGGPLIIESKGAFTQIGIVSWGSACRTRETSNVEGYADVADALPWIQRLILAP